MLPHLFRKYEVLNYNVNNLEMVTCRGGIASALVFPFHPGREQCPSADNHEYNISVFLDCVAYRVREITPCGQLVPVPPDFNTKEPKLFGEPIGVALVCVRVRDEASYFHLCLQKHEVT